MASSSAAPVSLLQGVRVLSFGSFVAGNLCPLLLAELGADVVKIESRERPEALRSYHSPDHGELFEPSGLPTAALYAGLARSVRSVCIDMRAGAGRDTFRALVAHADVVVENLGPGTMESWGCSFEALRAHNPRLVMLSISGYGRSGPLAGHRAYASNINNHLGLTAAWAIDGTHFDVVAAVHGASAVVAGLAAVEQGAPGVHVDLAQAETGAALMAPLYLDALANGREWEAAPNEVPGALFSGVVRCAGADAWAAIELEDARDWHVLCEYLGRDDLDRHGLPVAPPPDREALRDAVEQWAAPLTPLQVTHKLQKIGLAAAPVQNSEDLWRDAQHRARGAFVEIAHPDIGPVEYPDTPSRLSRTPGRVVSRGARLGEHTAEVLETWLGSGATAVRELVDCGAIWQAPHEE